MNVFLDSSALAKRYVNEPGSALVDSVLQSASSLGLCSIAVPEVVSALCRRHREKVLSQQQYMKARAALLADIEDASIVQITSEVVLRAIEVLEAFPLRAVDALHISAAVEWGAEHFLSADRQQCAAARGYGLKVTNLST